ncbi:MAG: hypothetical protein RML72_09130, partial [Bacteroidia bacterium]|nr:hypothetical protein [Bacteroidia bacterium]
MKRGYLSEFKELIQKIAQGLDSETKVYTFDCSNLRWKAGSEFCPGKRRASCPKDQWCEGEERSRRKRKGVGEASLCCPKNGDGVDDEFCPGKRHASCPKDQWCEGEERSRRKRKGVGRGNLCCPGGSGGCCPSGNSCAGVIIKKVIIHKDTLTQAPLRMEIEKNIDGKILRFESEFPWGDRGHKRARPLLGGLNEKEREDLKALLRTPCVEELANNNPNYARLRQKLLGEEDKAHFQIEKQHEKNGLSPVTSFSDLRCFPNPNEGTFTVEFSVPE